MSDNHELQPVKSHLQMMPIEQAKSWYSDFVKFSKSLLKADLDYGTIPGTPKPCLYKPGAEKLRFVYGLEVKMECIEKTVDLDRPFLDYTYRCTVEKNGLVLGQCEGSCNSLEPKYGYVWKTAEELPVNTDLTKLVSKVGGKKLSEYDFAINRANTEGQYGKPKEYWDMWLTAIEEGRARKIKKKNASGRQFDAWEIDDTRIAYRMINPDAIGLKNTIMKMAQKRAFVGAILLATGASEFFTQDIEDMEVNGHVHSNENTVEDVEFVHDAPPDDVEPLISGMWHARLERCKTPEDVDSLGKQYAGEVNANPALRKLFVRTKDELKKQPANDLPF
jgi:hypothetical protein